MDALPEWALDQADAALGPYLASRSPGWPAPEPGQAGAAFLATNFSPHLPQDGSPSLLTGYYEPEIAARLTPGGAFTHPLYRPPPDPALSRKAIDSGALAGQGFEIAWIADPVDGFFLEVQGSGRLILPGGDVLRLGYAGQNGHPYRSLGKEMIARGLIPEDRISAEAIRLWLRDHPDQVADLLATNPSYVYFRILDLGPDQGPIGTAGVPLTALRSLAVDPAHIPLGAPVLVETMSGGQPFHRLMIAQDTGGAIKGAQRGDIFFGSGAKAGLAAGDHKAPGRLTVLLPRGA